MFQYGLWKRSIFHDQLSSLHSTIHWLPVRLSIKRAGPFTNLAKLIYQNFWLKLYPGYRESQLLDWPPNTTIFGWPDNKYSLLLTKCHRDYSHCNINCWSTRRSIMSSASGICFFVYIAWKYASPVVTILPTKIPATGLKGETTEASIAFFDPEGRGGPHKPVNHCLFQS